MTATSTTAEESSKQDDELPESSEVISYDECFDLLSNHRRRYVLHYLQQNGDVATLSDLAEQIAAWENGIEITDLSYDQRKRVYTSLQQVHLPRMDDARVIEFDDREGSVEIGPAADNLDIYLEVVPDGYLPWSDVYLGTSIVVATLVVALYLVPIPFVSSWHALVLSSVLFLAMSLVHSYRTRQNRLYRP